MSDLSSRLEAELRSCLPGAAGDKTQQSKRLADLEEQCRSASLYPLQAGGKRVRPLLCLRMAGAIGGSEALELAWPAACALELAHTYSLVHDDLPCMDNDDLRRGKPTTHKIYGEAKGLLVGDHLLGEAFGVLARSPATSPLGLAQGAVLASWLASSLADGVGGASGMLLGQWLDLSLTGKLASEPSWEEVERVHLLKTGALLGSVFEMGWLCGATWKRREEPIESWSSLEEQRARARVIGQEVGLAFQLVDDLLDGSRSSTELGKTAGKDLASGKATAPRLLGEIEARRRAETLTRSALESAKALFQSPFAVSSAEADDFRADLLAMLGGLLRRQS